MKVKIIANAYITDFEENINKFIEGKSIHDIKYATTAVNNQIQHRVMILYSNSEEKVENTVRVLRR